MTTDIDKAAREAWDRHIEEKRKPFTPIDLNPYRMMIKGFRAGAEWREGQSWPVAEADIERLLSWRDDYHARIDQTDPDDPNHETVCFLNRCIGAMLAPEPEKEDDRSD